MKKTFLYCTLLVSTLFSCQAFAQVLKSDAVSYTYYKRPALFISPDIKNYQVSIHLAYLEKNRELANTYEASRTRSAQNYQKQMADYDAAVKGNGPAANMELADNDGSSIKAMMLNSINTPKLSDVTVPELQTGYDTTALADTYIDLKGYKNDLDNALKVVITLNGFEHTKPEMVSSKPSKGIVRYHEEFLYRHTMQVKVSTPDGKEVYNTTLPQLEGYKLYQSTATDNADGMDAEMLLKNAEERVLSDNLKLINNLLIYAFTKVKRETSLFYMKDNSGAYTDVFDAYKAASAGLSILQQDPASAKAQLDKADKILTLALGENSNRFDQHSTTALYLNLLEINFAQSNFSRAQQVIGKLETYNLSADERERMNDIDVLITDILFHQQALSQDVD